MLTTTGSWARVSRPIVAAEAGGQHRCGCYRRCLATIVLRDRTDDVWMINDGENNPHSSVEHQPGAYVTRVVAADRRYALMVRIRLSDLRRLDQHAFVVTVPTPQRHGIPQAYENAFTGRRYCN